MPRRAPELSTRLAREGSGRKPLVGRGPGMALLSTLVESEEHRNQAASGSLFLWILSFGETKESISAVGPGTDFKQNRRDSDTSSPLSDINSNSQ
jgi:hypothetical protein